MPPDRLAAVLAAGQRRSVATGAPPGPAQREVMDNSDLMVAVLTALFAGENYGYYKKACQMATRWCASHKGACDDDDTWRQLREFVFPDTAGTSPPYAEYIKSNRQWFRMLCQGLQEEMREVEQMRMSVERFELEHQKELARAREIYERTGEKQAVRRVFGRGRALLRYEQCKLELKVILWDRWRKDLKYLKPNPLFFAELSDEYWAVLTEEEMRAQLDALEGRQDDSAAGALGGD